MENSDLPSFQNITKYIDLLQKHKSNKKPNSIFIHTP